MTRASQRTSRGGVITLGLGAAAAAAVHVVADWRYPVAWVDEAHFLAPARSLLRHGTLAAPQLNAPDGLYWLPDGYSILVAPVAAWPAAARALSLVAVVTFAALLLTAAGRGRLRGAVAVAGALAAWLVHPGVVMMANIARMEAAVLALAGAAVMLASRRRWTAAVAVAALAPLLHPLGLVVAGAATAVAASWRRGVAARADRVLAGGVALAWLAETVRFATHWELAAAHLGFQFTRKAARSLQASPAEMALLALCAAGLVAVAAGRRGHRTTVSRRDEGAAVAALCLLLAGGFLVAVVLGNEMWYEPLGVPTALVLLAAAAGAVGWWERLAVGLPAAVAAGVAVTLLAATLTQPRYGMAVGTGAAGEWDAFVAAAAAELDALDGGLERPATVAIHRLSGIGPWLYDRPWRRLRVVQPTPVTPLPPGAADLLLYTLDSRPAADEVTRAELPPGPALLTLRSAQGTFTLLVYEAPSAGTAAACSARGSGPGARGRHKRMAIDRETLDRIREALDDAEGVDARRIDVLSDDGGVVLRGAVAAVEEASVAAMVAERHTERVRNELDVDPNLREDAAGADLVGPPDAPPAEGLDDPQRATEFATGEMGGVVTDDLAEALGENVAWEPPHEPVGVPTVAEERGVLDHEVGAVDVQDPGALDESEADATTPSAPDLSAAELRRAAGRDADR